MLRDWNKRFAFWTLDLSGIRHIVKSFPGAPKGGRLYKRWTGPDLGEDDEWQGTIAFAENKPNSNYMISAAEEVEQ